MGRLVALVVVVVALAAPAAALAQSDPLTPVAPGSQQPAPQPISAQAPASTADTGGGGLTTWQQALIFVGGVALIAGIGVVIVRDAHRRAPVHPGEPVEAVHHNRTTGQRRRDRARSQAARRQRRRNRAR